MILKQIIRYENAPAIEATWADENDVVVKCQAYSNGQMGMLRADLGADAAEHEALIAEIEATYVPPEPEQPVIPQTITRAQGKASLIQAGMLAGVVAYVAAIEDDTERALAEVALNDTQEWKRSSPFLTTAAAALGLDGAALDALFLMASQIEL